MTDDLTTQLCTRCGLCCDGSLFDDVELANQDEAEQLEAMGLDIDLDEQPLLLEPCTALNRRMCSIYEHRPECCRTFECRLLQRANRNMINVDAALAVIKDTRMHTKRMRSLCALLGVDEPELPLKETCIEALSQPVSVDDPNNDELRADLAEAMDKMARIVNEEFLG